jgi:hypothetical protein
MLEQGLLTLSEGTSHAVHWQKRDRSSAGVSIEHFALSFLKCIPLSFPTSG